jgi:hypothetical protein
MPPQGLVWTGQSEPCLGDSDYPVQTFPVRCLVWAHARHFWRIDHDEPCSDSRDLGRSVGN